MARTKILVDGKWMPVGAPIQGGTAGADGKDGYSPIITLMAIEGGTQIQVRDAEVQSGESLLKTADILNGEDGTSVSIRSRTQNNSSGGESKITFSDDTTLSVWNGKDGKDGTNGTNGTSVSVKSVTNNTGDGEYNTVTFTDGKSVKIYNGSKGSKGDPYTLTASDKDAIAAATLTAFKANPVVDVGADYTTARVRNIQAGTTAPTSSIGNGNIFLVYKT